MITLTPSQVLLLLIRELGKHSRNKADLEKVKKIYLTGFNPITDASTNIFIGSLIAKHTRNLGTFKITYDFESIDKDPTRRYFESRLALNSIHVTEREPIEFKEHFNSLKESISHSDYLLSLLGEPDKKLPLPDPIKHCEQMLSKLSTEYRQSLEQLKSVKGITELERTRLELSLKCAYLGVTGVITYKGTLPINIYGTGIYSAQARGVYSKNQPTVRSANLGILKSYNPNFLDDTTFSEHRMDGDRSPERSFVDKKSQWAIENLQKLVNPFGNSISGTMLCQLRWIKHLHNIGSLKIDNLEKYCKEFLCSLLFSQGGHTLQEFLAVLKLPAIQKEFTFVKGFLQIDMVKMFYNDNSAVIDKTFREAILYNDSIINKKKIHEELTEPQKKKFKTTSDAPFITKRKELKQWLLNYNNGVSNKFMDPNSKKNFVDSQQLHSDFKFALKSYLLIKKSESKWSSFFGIDKVSKITAAQTMLDILEGKKSFLTENMTKALINDDLGLITRTFQALVPAVGEYVESEEKLTSSSKPYKST